MIDEEPFLVRLEQIRARQEEAESALKKAEESKAVDVAQAQLELDLSQLAAVALDEARSRGLIDRRCRHAGRIWRSPRRQAGRMRPRSRPIAPISSRKRPTTSPESLPRSRCFEAAKADVRNAEIDLGYCRVTAPIDGRISRSELDVGNYVGDGMATVLATIVKTDPIRRVTSTSVRTTCCGSSGWSARGK